MSTTKAAALQILAKITKKVEKATDLDPSDDIRALVPDSISGHEIPGAMMPTTDLVDDCRELMYLLQGPTRSLSELAFSTLDVATMSVLLDFEIARAVPQEGEISFADLAQKVDMSEEKLEQIVCYTSTNFIFKIVRPGYLTHTPMSSRLATDTALSASLGMWCNDVQKASGYLSDQLRQFPHSESPVDTAFNLAFRTDKTYFDYINQPTEHKRLMRFKTTQTAVNGTAWPLRVLSESFPWGNLGKDVLVVDAGGNNGFVARELARVHTNLRFVVQDLGRLVEEGRRELKETEDADVRSRVSFMEHDFFQPQPLTANVYLFRQVLHDWPDESCRQILRNLLPTLQDGCKVLIADSIIPGSGQTRSKVIEKSVRQRDILLLTVNNAKERTEAGFIDLFDSIDDRLKFQKIWKSRGAGSECIFELAYNSNGW